MDHRLRRRDVLVGAGTAATAALAGCAAIGGDGGPALRIGTIQPPLTLDPLVAKTVGSEQVVGRIFEGLYAHDGDTALRPRIADGPPVREGPRSVRVRLDPSARFQNGDPITPADVRYSMRAPVEEDTAAKGAVSPIESVEPVGNRSVRIVTGHPAPTLDAALTLPIVPKSIRASDPEGFRHDPVGAGPFEVADFSEGTKATLTRWTDYWGQPDPAVDRVTFAHVESPFTAMTSLLTNRSDVVEPVSEQVRGTLGNVAGAAVAARPSYRSYYFGFNTNEGPTTDPKIRAAIANTIDLADAVDEFMGPLGRRQYGPVPPTVARDWGFPRDRWRSTVGGKDLEAARSLFQSASTSPGRLTILTTKDPRWRQFGERLARGIRDAGQAARVDAAEWSTYTETFVSGAKSDYAVFVGEIAGTSDPDSFLYPVVHENMEGVTNGLFYHEESVMNAILAGRRTTDRTKRRSHYVAAIDRILRDHALLPICSVETSFAHDRSVEGLHVDPIPERNPALAGPNGVVTVGGSL